MLGQFIGRGAVATKNAETLPKMLPGTVCAQLVRCGRPTCRCARGELHGPYYYRFFRHGGRLKKAYVKQADVARVRARCAARRRLRRELNAGWEAWRQLLALVRKAERP